MVIHTLTQKNWRQKYVIFASSDSSIFCQNFVLIKNGNQETTYMSVYWSNDKIGIAYYGTEECVFYMMFDTQEIMATNVFKKGQFVLLIVILINSAINKLGWNCIVAYLQVLPTTLLVCSKDKDKITTALKEMSNLWLICWLKQNLLSYIPIILFIKHCLQNQMRIIWIKLFVYFRALISVSVLFIGVIIWQIIRWRSKKNIN